ncbi:TPA: ead/Ea22-like family protein [Klebsiella pneumoniae]|uniref:ead/Ea22-like family protein n=1 Tax=Klebsiella pneumoniae TaxID=573 RepID=UPI000F507B80|nr:ead/Ea22-like family protein [Klebsiella pneumoniae]AYY35214.1 ead/Ea22-like family protein [Klebsiella pneumoniae]EKZ5557344.1 ead/Ea22-like family protein [Klebsiella pneumoniae]EKZ5698993.1 ead/Ea22-like family protein [Klebsiella pneumoniae]EKZ6494022.1 ead/Ea22-like family protein [Klebsiella pneumoniae]ELA2506358.1 ead/Ea22-like family protein [Klebsiella pneumoniae]
MTDITELAQSLKAAAEKATPGNWRAFQYHDGRCGIGGGHNAEIMVCEHISKERPHDAMFIALANPANILALVEALEKAQAKADVYDMLRDDYGLREKGVGLADFVDWQAKCIAELESRTVTVKLPKPHAHLIWIQAGHAPDDYWDDVAVSHSEKDRCCDGSERYPVYARWEIEEMLAAAGIKVEAE